MPVLDTIAKGALDSQPRGTKMSQPVILPLSSGEECVQTWTGYKCGQIGEFSFWETPTGNFCMVGTAGFFCIMAFVGTFLFCQFLERNFKGGKDSKGKPQPNIFVRMKLSYWLPWFVGLTTLFLSLLFVISSLV